MLFRFLTDMDALGELGAGIRDEIMKLDGATQDTKVKVSQSLSNLADAAQKHIVALEASHASSTDFLKLVNASKDYLDTVFEVHSKNLSQIVGDKDNLGTVQVTRGPDWKAGEENKKDEAKGAQALGDEALGSKVLTAMLKVSEDDDASSEEKGQAQ